MPLGELTNNRPSIFSSWHRPPNLPVRCALADADWFEVREGRVVAIEETIQVKEQNFDDAGKWIITDPWLKSWYPKYDARYPLWETKRVVLNYLIGSTRLPFFIIYHTPDMSQVRLIDYRRKEIKDFTGKQFGDWLTMKW